MIFFLKSNWKQFVTLGKSHIFYNYSPVISFYFNIFLNWEMNTYNPFFNDCIDVYNNNQLL